MRVLQKRAGIAFFVKRLGRNHAVNQTIHSINDDKRGNFAAGHHIVADANFVVNIFVDNPLVDSFVSAANYHKLFFPAQFLRFLLRQGPSAWGHVNNALSLFVGLNAVKRFSKRLRQHKLPRPSAIRTVITSAVFVKSEISDIHQIVGNNSLFNRLRHD